MDREIVKLFPRTEMVRIFNCSGPQSERPSFFYVGFNKHLQALAQGSRVAEDPPLMEDGSMSMYSHRGKNRRIRNLKFSQAYI